MRYLGTILSPTLLMLALGCVPVDSTPNPNEQPGHGSQAPTAPTDPNSPRLIIPATGGAPVLATPLGGGLYLPVTGGAPVPGTPVHP